MRKLIYSTVVVLFLCFHNTIPGFSQCISGDCFNGIGTYAYADGSRYEGNFMNGKNNGYGSWFFTNGDKYVGFFQNNFLHGEGIVYHNNGLRTEGEWINGEYFGAKDAQVEGCIEGNCINGYGTYIYENGNARYKGMFQKEMPHGEGICEYSNGETYEGEWAKGSFEGVGTLYLPNGSAVQGLWSNGTYMGVHPSSKPASKKIFSNNKPTDYNHQSKYAGSQNPIADIKNIRKNSKTKVWAVVIGISSYTNTPMPPLKYSDDDAYRMYAFLKSPEGGALKDDQIKMLIDEQATRKNIKQTMVEVFGNAGPNDLVMMYYSGHGLRGCFLPIDFNGFDNKLFHDEVDQILEQSPAKYKLVIADACHSGGLAMKGAPPSDAQLVDLYYSNLAKSNAGTALILSSKSEEISLESSGLRQGVFSHFLIRGLEGEADHNHDKVVDVSELYEFIFANVKSYTADRQTPVIKGSFDKRMTVSVVR